MPPQGEVARQWFIPGEGIDRNVISTDIQRYLGNDATVRPGAGTGEYQGVNGYWIKAYRNLTSAMIADLRADSNRWRQEQRQTGVGSSAYVGSDTFNQSNAAGVSRNSPSLDQYGRPAPMQGRPDDGRRPPPDQMQVDGPGGRAPQGQGYNQPGYYPQDGRGAFPQDPARGYAAQSNQRPAGPPGDPRYGQQDYNPYPSPAATVSSINQDPRGRDSFGNQPGYAQPSTPYDQYGNPPPQSRRPQGYPDQPMADYGQPDQYGRYPVNQAYVQERGPQYGQPVQVPPPGYAREGEHYVPMTSGYSQPGMMPTAGPGPQYPQQPQPGRPQNSGYAYPPEQPAYAPQTRDAGHGRPPARGDDRERRRNR